MQPPLSCRAKLIVPKLRPLYLVNMLPIDGRANQIVRVIVIIIGVLSLLSYLVNF